MKGKLLIILTIILSLFAAVVWPATIGETLKGMNLAVHGAPGTWSFMKPGSELVVLGWAQGEQYAFMILDKAGSAVELSKLTNANKMAWYTAADFVDWLEHNGWQSVPVTMLPKTIVASVAQASFIFSMSCSIFVVFMPVGFLDTLQVWPTGVPG